MFDRLDLSCVVFNFPISVLKFFVTVPDDQVLEPEIFALEALDLVLQSFNVKFLLGSVVPGADPALEEFLFSSLFSFPDCSWLIVLAILFCVGQIFVCGL